MRTYRIAVSALTVAATAMVLSGCTRSASKASAPPPDPTPAAAHVIPASVPAQATGDALQTEVPLEADGGTFLVPVEINGTIALKFTIDSGAADVSIPEDVASTLVRSGTIGEEDFIGTKTFTLADGTTLPSAEFRIRSLRVGTLVLHDVVGSLADRRGPLLLGQSFLSRLSSWSVDNGRHVLLLKAGPGAGELAASSSADDGSAASPASEADETAALLSAEDLKAVATEFHGQMQSGGMSGVTADVQQCYGSIGASNSDADRRRAAYCVTLDLLALRTDASFRSELQKQYGGAPPPVTPYYSEGEWQGRIRRFLPLTTESHATPNPAVFRRFTEGAEQQLVAVMNVTSPTGTTAPSE